MTTGFSRAVTILAIASAASDGVRAEGGRRTRRRQEAGVYRKG